MKVVEEFLKKEQSSGPPTAVKPQLKMDIDGHPVAIADDDQAHFDSSEFPSGYYITTYAIGRGKQSIVQPLYFDAGHDDMTTRTPRGRIAARINTAIANARSWIRDAKLAGWYE
jgi:hypothetical protein